MLTAGRARLEGQNSEVANSLQEERVDETMDISQREAEGTMRALARVEGIFAGPSSGGAISAALRLSANLQNATIVAIVCDRGDRYLSTGKHQNHHMPMSLYKPTTIAHCCIFRHLCTVWEALQPW